MEIHRKKCVNIDKKRRSLFKGAAAACAATVFTGGLSLDRLFNSAATAAQVSASPEPGKFIYSACLNNCGSSCVLKAFVRDGKVSRIETDNEVEDNWEKGIFQIRACPRGRSMRRHMYSPTRLKYPLRRVGKRGDGEFERISWDEALDAISGKMRECIDKYGNASIMRLHWSGVMRGSLMRNYPFNRLMNLLGGCTEPYLDYSSPQNQLGLQHLYGIMGYSGNPIQDLRHTKLAVLFGSNIMETRMSGGGLQYELLEAKKSGNTRIIIIDPRYSDSCATVADEWIPIRPGTDAALASALAYVLIEENMVDKSFLNSHCVGFDASTMPKGTPTNSSYSDYILGTGYDKTPKTPQWAAAITGIPVQRIYQLAREIGQAKPCYISQGWGPQRHFAGEWTTNSIASLAVLTGNVGVRGGGNGDCEAYYPGSLAAMPTGDNPQPYSFPEFMWSRAVEDGKSMTPANSALVGGEKFPTDVKFIWCYAGNTLINQHSDINNTKRILADTNKCEMIVVLDTHMTSSAQWADIVLPSCSYLEQEDFVGPSYAMDIDWLIASEKVEPFYESRPIYEICVDLAKRFGVENEFTAGRDREAWLQYLMDTQLRQNYPELPATLAELRKMGIVRHEKSRDLPVPMKDFRENPAKNPLDTPSGKIELYSEKLADLSKTMETGRYLGDVIPPTPQYVVTWDGYEDKQTGEKYPLQMIGYHYKGRTHSHYANVDWLLEVSPQMLWINPLDADERGIKHGDLLTVWNERGTVKIRAKVTPRIIPGVVAMPQGAWYKPDKQGVDEGGCINTLTVYRPTTLARSNPSHTNRVQVNKA